MQSKEESKQDFTKIKKLENAVGTFGEDTKDEDNVLDEDTAKQIKDIASA